MVNDQALAICQLHYKGWQAKINGCDKCPLHKECISDKPTRNEQELRDWEDSINRVALSLTRHGA